MGNIVVVILFLIFRAIMGQLSQYKKTQRRETTQAPQTSKIHGKAKRHSIPSIQDFIPKTTTTNESKAVKIKPGIPSMPVEKPLQKIIIQTYDGPEHRPQPESDGDIFELFTQENILRGIILQEVLSPPKALANRRH
ncbi:MAG: hypothetical protein ACOX8P_07405 [Tepidanaerobacteraceae bacterium]|jgi:hypothetical protein